MAKYLVISYDSDQQQWFYDIVFAEDSDKAIERIQTVRPYVMDADVLSQTDLERLQARFSVETVEESENYLKEVTA